MAAPMPVPSPEEDQPGQDQPQGGQPRFFYVPGSVLDGVEVSGPVPPEAMPGYQPGGLPAGLDWKELIDALAQADLLGSPDDEPVPGEQESPGGPEDRQDPARASTDPGKLAGLAVEHMPAGPALGGWLEVAADAAAQLDENQLTGVVNAARKQTCRAQAMLLGAAAQLAARAAAADPDVGVLADGRPARVTRDAAGQLEMALLLSHNAAEELADLAVTLTWRLRATGAALGRGWIDLDRAELIAAYTSVLSEQLARQVEAVILPAAPGLTIAQLRRKLAQLVITADPEGADKRRKDAERLADVRLYADDDHTATLIADKLPQIPAAAGYTRINALAWARKNAGLPGSIRQHRAHIILELILGTLEFIPPPQAAPPDQPPPPDDDPPPSGGQPPPSPPSDAPPAEPPSHQPTPSQSGSGHNDLSRCEDHPSEPGDNRGHQHDGRPRDDSRQDQARHQDASQANTPGDELPAPRDEDAPGDDGLDDTGPAEPALDPWDDDDLNPAAPAPQWPALGTIPPALASASRRPAGTPPAALLDLTLPWASYAGLTSQPAILGRIGAITATQARQLAQAAEHDPSAQWRIIITDHHGHALAVTRIPRPRRTGPPATGPPATGPPATGPPARAGLAGRITLIISEDLITRHLPAATRNTKRRPAASPAPTGEQIPLSAIAAAAIRAAARALNRARKHAAADTAAGGCAHTTATPSYRPPPRLREYIIARDATCRSPVCGQPAWRADLDHTRPHHLGGPTCPCNLGGACRREHQLKQHPRWKLQQTKPGYFTWTAPSGRTYHVSPEVYPH